MTLLLSSLSLFFVATNAQEVPTLSMDMFTYNFTYRQDVCDRHDNFYNGDVELRNALSGFELHSLIRVGEYFNIDEDTGGIDEEDPGLVAVILDELSERGGFTWRDSYGVTDGPGENKTWTDLVVWAVEAYDVSVDWWMHSSERLKLGIGFPEGFVEAHYIMIGIKQDDDDAAANSGSDTTLLEKFAYLYAWTQPFSTSVWLFICATIIVSAILYAIFESLALDNNNINGSGVIRHSMVNGSPQPLHGTKQQWGPSLYGTILICLQHFQLRPRTRAGRIIGVSVAFWSLIMTATCKYACVCGRPHGG